LPNADGLIKTCAFCFFLKTRAFFCNGPIKTGHQLCLTCPFAWASWSIVVTWKNIGNLQPILQTSSDSLSDWWELALPSIQKDKRRGFNGMAIYIICNLWKERNRKIFDNKYSQPPTW
jgi:hypothetical protein